jgi:lipopolysaccharide biosynthesis glycosyltransferase
MGFDTREVLAYSVAEYSASRFNRNVIPLRLNDLRDRELYSRPIDPLSSTEFSFSRFLVPLLNNYDGWALFVDCDILFISDPLDLLQFAEDKYAVMCVKHDYNPTTKTKMDDKVQYLYPRKNWSSVMLFNCGHHSNKKLTKEVVNSASGSFLHQMKWLVDEEIGELPKEWNWLTDWYVEPRDGRPKLLHYTEGGPWFEKYQDCAYANIWKDTKEEYLKSL